MARPHGCCQTADRWFHGLHASKKSRQSRLFRPMPPLQNRPAAVDKRRFLKDSASTMADMIPLPTPARLGLLRFERLSDPGWPLLYLDSACDAELGLPAAGLCTPAGDNYASLISDAGWKLRRHIQVPLSTQQVHPDIVNKFRESRRLARLERYLLVAEA